MNNPRYYAGEGSAIEEIPEFHGEIRDVRFHRSAMSELQMHRIFARNRPIQRDERGGFVMDLRDRCDA